MANQLRIGTKIEAEHRGTVRFIKRYLRKYRRLPPNRKIFSNIAREHLREDKRYYIKLRKAKL